MLLNLTPSMINGIMDSHSLALEANSKIEVDNYQTNVL